MFSVMADMIYDINPIFGLSLRCNGTQNSQFSIEIPLREYNLIDLLTILH